MVFEATSAEGARGERTAVRRGRASAAIDLTPAAVGPYVCPPVNLDVNLDAPNLNMITCGGQATIPIVARGQPRSSRSPTPRSSRRSRPARPDRAPGRTSTSSPRPPPPRCARSAAPQQGKAIIILNPVEPPMIMRDTVFCAIPAEAAEPGRCRTPSPAASTRWPTRCATTCPATRCAPSRSTTRRISAGAAWPGSAVFLEVRGRGDYLPPYAGNLDIMTAAAARVGELLAATCAGPSGSVTSGMTHAGRA